ncbi:MAG: hypothetical protein Q8O88_05305 [bacterium]|nr:hypothetical protein [bacterium]
MPKETEPNFFELFNPTKRDEMIKRAFEIVNTKYPNFNNIYAKTAKEIAEKVLIEFNTQTGMAVKQEYRTDIIEALKNYQPNNATNTIDTNTTTEPNGDDDTTIFHADGHSPIKIHIAPDPQKDIGYTKKHNIKTSKH